MSVLVGRQAPDFNVSAVQSNGEIVDNFSFYEATRGKYALLFFYPLDFTFVCPSELIALDHRMDDFKKRDIVVIGISIDSQFTHFAWRNTPTNKGGIGHVKYTLAADVNHRVCEAYGIEHPDAGVAFRGAFLIDKKGIVRSQIINDLPFGRNIDEIIRLFDAIEFFEQNGEVCPANWKKGDPGMKPTTEGVASYLAKRSQDL